MRTDVKVGLISIFAVILGVVIYFVAQGNARPRESRADTPTNTPARTVAGGTSPTTAPAAAGDVTGLNIAAPTSPTPPSAPAGASGTPGTGTTPVALAQAGTPGNTSVGGGMIAPPAPNSSIIPPSTPAAPGTSGTPSNFTGNTPTGSAFNSPPLGGGVPTTPGSNAGTSGTNNTFGSSGTSIIPPPSSPTTRPSHAGSSSTLDGNNSSTIAIEPPSRNTPTTPPGNSTFGSNPNGSRNRITSPGTPDSSLHTSLTSSGSANTYTIQKGDTLSTIAKKFNVSVKAIEAANPGIDSTRLKINKPINIPAASSSTSIASTTDHTTPTSPATRPGRTGTSAGGTTVAHATAKSPTAAKPGSTYVIKKGDTLASIAQAAYGDKKAYKRIFRANRGELASANSIPVGTTIHLPS